MNNSTKDESKSGSEFDILITLNLYHFVFTQFNIIFITVESFNIECSKCVEYNDHTLAQFCKSGVSKIHHHFWEITLRNKENNTELITKNIYKL